MTGSEYRIASDSNRPRRAGVQSVAIGMRVLQALAEMGGAGNLGAIARGCSLPSPQAHRYLLSLVEAGMVRQTLPSGQYELGSAVLRLGLAALARTDAFTLADREIVALVNDTHQSVQISALGPSGPTVIRIYMGQPPVVTALKVGSILPMLSSATGLVFASFSPPAEVAGLIEREASLTNLTQEAVADILKSIRDAGFAQDDGHLIPGLRAIAYPIRDSQGRAVLVATAIATKAINHAYHDGAAEKLRQACARVSTDLGWSSS